MKINPIIQWWMTPKLPKEDIFGLPLLMDKSPSAVRAHLFSKWLIHPLKRRLAKVYLNILKNTTDIKVIGVTGSAGKSTTVAMISSVLSAKGPVVSTPAGIDPVYNVPNTILRTRPGTKYLVLELSVEYQGEMDYYLWLARPDVGVITNIFPAHTLFLGGLEGVLKEKSKLVTSLSKKDVAVLNSSDPLLKSLSRKIKSKILWFKKGDDLMEENKNCASTVAEYLGLNRKETEKRLEEFKAPKHRLEIVKSPKGYTIMDDTYNSNPKAAVAAVKYFNKISGKSYKIAVLGDMLELGNFEKEGHKLLGKEVAHSGFAAVVGVGKSIKYSLDEVSKYSKKTKVFLLQKPEKAVTLIKPYLKKNSFIFVKGSRSIGLDKVVEKLI